MENYVPPDDSDDDGGRGKKTKKKDPNAPERGQTNFMIFSSHVRAKVKEENPDATFGQIVSIQSATHFVMCTSS